MEMVRRINHKAPHYYMRQCPQLACNTEASIEMPAHLSILPVAQRFEGFARNDDTRKTIHALSMRPLRGTLSCATSRKPNP